MEQENSNSTCSFSDALYVTADEGLIPGMLSSAVTNSSYYSATSNIDDTYFQSSDSGLSSSFSPGYFLESQVDLNLLEETLGDDLNGDNDGDDDVDDGDDDDDDDGGVQITHWDRKIVNEENVEATHNVGKLILSNETIDSRSIEDDQTVPDTFIIVPPIQINAQNQNSVVFDIPTVENDSSRNISQTSTDTASNYTFDGEYIENDMVFEQLTMEPDDGWQPCAESSPTKKEAREKIFIRDLSFDELQDVKGVDLMAPVFLAVTNDADDNVLCDMRRKAKSIEDLCSTIGYPKNKDIVPRQRSRSTNSRKQKNKPKEPSPLSMEVGHYNEENPVEVLEDAKARLSSLSASLNSHFSYENLYSPTSTNSYHTSIEFEISNSPNFRPSPMESLNGETGGDLEDLNELQVDDEDEQTSEVPNDTYTYRIPHRVDGENCGFWEYPYGSPSNPSSPEPSKTTESMRTHSINTSPTSPGGGNTGGSDRFIVVDVDEQQRIVDMKLIEPYLMILTHGGHHIVDNVCHVIVVFNARYLPHRNIPKYNIVMEQLFYYCAHALNLLVSDSYEMVFFNSAMNSNNIPPRKMIKQCYDIIQYRLRKKLQNIYFVHPTLLLKTVLRFTRFFISNKFRRKMHFVKNLKTLKNFLPLDYIFISPELRQIEKKFT